LKKFLKPLLLLPIGHCSLALISAPTLHYFTYRQEGLSRGIWQAGSAQAPITQADLTGDGLEESLQLRDGRVTVFSATEIIYVSQPGWTVRQAEFADLNGDGHVELVMLVWREFQPWPVDRLLPAGGRISAFHDADGQSCHLILLGWRDGRAQEDWAGSALAEPVLSFSISDLNGDGRQELITLDGDYAKPLSLPAKAVRIWEWNGFGFSRLEQIDLPARQILISKNSDGARGMIIANQ
jgi:hypothetical protein